MLRVVVIEDEPAIADLIARSLRRSGHEVTTASTAVAGLDLIANTGPDVVLLDLGLPDHDGLDVLRDIRRSDEALGVICVTARVDEIDRILGFEVGADDYVTKPFSPRELNGRVKALGRRVLAARGSRDADNGVLTAGTLEVDCSSRQVTIDGASLDLTRMEFDLLAHLLSHKGHACERLTIVESVWGHSWLGQSRTLDVHVGQLRRKLDDSVTITTLRGVGYRLEA